MKFFRVVLYSVILSCFFGKSVSAIDVGDVIPACILNEISKPDTLMNLQSLKKQVLYVDFWASWCGPCAQSFPFMNQLDNDKKSQGLQVVAINLDENIKDAQQFLNKIPANFTIALDADQQCAKLFDVPAMPSSYLIDRKGVIRYIHLGFRSGETGELEAMIEALLAESK